MAKKKPATTPPLTIATDDQKRSRVALRESCEAAQHNQRLQTKYIQWTAENIWPDLRGRFVRDDPDATKEAVVRLKELEPYFATVIPLPSDRRWRNLAAKVGFIFDHNEPLDHDFFAELGEWLRAKIKPRKNRSDNPTAIDIENVRAVMQSMGTRNPAVEDIRKAVKTAGYRMSATKIGKAVKIIRKK
jgi:hypothetical protein